MCSLRAGFITLRQEALAFLVEIAESLPEGDDLRRQMRGTECMVEGNGIRHRHINAESTAYLVHEIGGALLGASQVVRWQRKSGISWPLRVVCCREIG